MHQMDTLPLKISFFEASIFKKNINDFKPKKRENSFINEYLQLYLKLSADEKMADLNGIFVDTPSNNEKKRHHLWRPLPLIEDDVIKHFPFFPCKVLFTINDFSLDSIMGVVETFLKKIKAGSFTEVKAKTQLLFGLFNSGTSTKDFLPFKKQNKIRFCIKVEGKSYINPFTFSKNINNLDKPILLEGNFDIVYSIEIDFFYKKRTVYLWVTTPKKVKKLYQKRLTKKQGLEISYPHMTVYNYDEILIAQSLLENLDGISGYSEAEIMLKFGDYCFWENFEEEILGTLIDESGTIYQLDVLQTY